MVHEFVTPDNLFGPVNIPSKISWNNRAITIKLIRLTSRKFYRWTMAFVKGVQKRKKDQRHKIAWERNQNMLKPEINLGRRKTLPVSLKEQTSVATFMSVDDSSEAVTYQSIPQENAEHWHRPSPSLSFLG